jgi:hypothetical protein
VSRRITLCVGACVLTPSRTRRAKDEGAEIWFDDVDPEDLPAKAGDGGAAGPTGSALLIMGASFEGCVHGRSCSCVCTPPTPLSLHTTRAQAHEAGRAGL